jgi:seryl-tRNA synthetase
MLDIKLIRERPDFVKAQLAKVQFPPSGIDELLSADRARREALQVLESHRAERARRSREIGALPPEQRRASGAAVKSLTDAIASAEAAAAEAEKRFEELMLSIPNLPHESVPEGPDETANVVVRTSGELPRFDFQPRPHWEIGPELNAIDFERGIKISGSRFYVLTGIGARLQRALITFMLDVHTQEHGYTEVYPPAMVRGYCLVGTGNLPKFQDTVYRDIEDDFWFVPTAEVPVTNLYRDEVLDVSQLPIWHVAYSPCFRRE